MLNYKAIEIFTDEEARYGNKPVSDAVIQYLQSLKIAARCIVTRGIAGCYETGEVATSRLEVLSINMPIRIYIVVPAAEIDRVLDGLNGMVNDGIIAIHDLNVISHRTRTAFFPRQLTVRDTMTPAPEQVRENTPVREVIQRLLPAVFTGLPVVNENQCPVGVVTQGDLIRKGGLPLRLGLLSESDDDRQEALLSQLSSQKTSDIMTAPAITVEASKPLTDAVDVMLAKKVKRLPVVDEKGQLCGILSRLDIFRTVMREAPDWGAFKAQKIDVNDLKYVGEITRRDSHTVFPETTLGEVIRRIDSNDIQRIAVVDPDQRLKGVISDRDLLRYFKSTPQEQGIRHLLSKVTSAFKKHLDIEDVDNASVDLQHALTETTAGAVMTTDPISVHETMRIEAAIELMVDKRLKRLPVIDDDGRFKGMISRDSLLRIGFGKTI